LQLAGYREVWPEASEIPADCVDCEPWPEHRRVMDITPNCRTKQNGGLSADGTTYTVHLRPGAKWNTSPACEVTSEDVVLGLKRLSTGEPCRGLGNGHERLNTRSAPFPSIRTGYQRCRPKEGCRSQVAPISWRAAPAMESASMPAQARSSSPDPEPGMPRTAR
jgi:hypothetical protein